ncbi:MAG: endonuclease domain-containing protein [Dietzia sp.]
MTSAARTAIDVARWEDDDETAIAKIDSVCNRSRIDVCEVGALATDLRGLHGLQRVRRLLQWCDQRADSPPETRLRLLIVRSELPDPIPQVEIYNEYGAKVATADLAYEIEKVAIFYDGDIHRGRSTWEYDARVNAELPELGWQVVRVTGPMLRNPRAVLRQIGAALERGRAKS